MAISLDASTPAFAASSTKPWTTASFNPPNNSTLVAVVLCDAMGAGDTIVSVTDSLSQLTFAPRRRDGTNVEGVSEIFTAQVGMNGGARTISATEVGSTTPAGGVKIYVLIGADQGVNPSDIVNGGSGIVTNNLTANAFTTALDGCWVFGGGAEWQSLGVPTSTDVGEGFDDLDMSFICVRKSAATTPAAAVTLNFNAAGSGTNDALWSWSAISVLPLVASSGDTGTLAWTPVF